MFLALFRPHFNPRYFRAKMSLSRAKNIFMPANINSINAKMVDSTKFGNEAHFMSFATIVATRNGQRARIFISETE